MTTTTFPSPFSGSDGSVKHESNYHSPNDTMRPPLPTANSSSTTAPAKPKSKPRKRVNTAEKRHQHNAVERQRRETLNGKFLSLARLLPSLASHRRPSKSAIVNGSIAHLTHQRDQRLLAARLLRKLCADHDAMLAEVNEWRKANGFAAKETGSAWTDEVDEVCSVEKEVFGDFSTMGNEGDDDQEDDVECSSLEQSTTFPVNYGMQTGFDASRQMTDFAAIARAQALFGNMPLPDMMTAKATQPSTATINGGGLWSDDFAFQLNGGHPQAPVRGSTMSSSFSTFMSDSIDQSSTGSPANSQLGGSAVLTPPTEGMLYNHTPSPANSAHSNGEQNEIKTATATQPWNPQMLFLQQQAQAAQLRQQHQQFSGLMSNDRNVAASTGLATEIGSDAFTQQLLASIFPSNGVNQDQVQAWRKAALGSLLPQQQQGNLPAQQPSVDDLRVSQVVSI